MESTKNDCVRGNGGVGIRKTLSSSLSNSNILSDMEHNDYDTSKDTSFKSKSVTLSTSSVINVTGSKMIQRIFVSCTIFVIGTIHYGSVSMMKHDSRNTSTTRNGNHNEMTETLDLISFNRNANTKEQMTTEETNQRRSTTSEKKTEASKSAIASFVRNEMGRMKSSGINPCTINSEVWLNSTRYGNMNQVDDDTYLTHDLVQHMILNLPNALNIMDQAQHADP